MLNHKEKAIKPKTTPEKKQKGPEQCRGEKGHWGNSKFPLPRKGKKRGKKRHEGKK